MKKYLLNIPTWAHCMTAYGISKRDAVKRFKHQHCITRMPNGYGIWEATA
jgi:hypothetical protein